MDGIGPLAMFYSWQSVLCAVACVGLSKVPTTIIDIRMGKAKRKENKILTDVVYPALPVVIGVLYACIVPLRPEPLMEFVTEQVDGLGWQLVAYGAYGGACGQFSQTLYDKLIQPILSVARGPKGPA